jgi:uncharacterized protein YggE
VQVIGQGKVSVHPDGTLVNLGVIALKSDTPETAVQPTTSKIDAVSQALVDTGIPKENQTITGYVLNPIFDTAAPAGYAILQPGQVDVIMEITASYQTK